MAFVKKRRIDAKECCNQWPNDCFNTSHCLNLKHKTINHLNSCSKTKCKIQSKIKLKQLLCDQKLIERFLRGDEQTFHYNSDHSLNVVDFLSSRSIDNKGSRRAQLSNSLAAPHLLSNNLLREQVFNCDSFNKVFSSQWLNDQSVVFGTKCNKLIVLNVFNGKQHSIPTLKSSVKAIEPENPCGIHSIQLNPSQTLLATGGHNPNDVAIYRLPTLDPVCVGEGAHTDWIFDLTWLDDQFLISGSRDSTLALWRFDESNDSLNEVSGSSVPIYSHRPPLMTKVCNKAEKIRALLYNNKIDDVVVLSLNAQIHLFDCKTLKQKKSIPLPFPTENVCLSQQLDHNLYAVGSKAHVSLLDDKNLLPINKIPSKSPVSGIRSLSFNNDLLTIGTGGGTVLFYDIRANKYLEDLTNNNSHTFLKASKGYVIPEDLFNDFQFYFQFEYMPAIYTHQYDVSKTRLFIAGGPLPANLTGSYASLWA